MWWHLLWLIPAVSAFASILQTSIGCDKNDFVLKMQFNETFTGSIFTEQGSPNCVYVNGSIQSMTSYNIKIPLAGCETRRNSEGHLENEVVVQSGSTFDASKDRRFLLTCIPAAPKLRDSLVTVSFGGVTVDPASSTAVSITASNPINYKVSVRDGDNPRAPELNRPLAVGDRLTYTVELGRQTPGRVGRCWASDERSSLELADEHGCSLQKSGSVWSDFEVLEGEDGTRLVNHIKAWAFPTSNEVNIFCNLHVCANCRQPDCKQRNRRHGAPSDPFSSPILSMDAPPIPIRASFRLRREAPPTESPSPMRQQRQSASPSAVRSLPLLPLFLLLSLLVWR